VATSGVPLASSTNPVHAAANSAILVWVTTRTIAPDANPQSHVVSDNQGGTYTRVGAEKVHQRRGQRLRLAALEARSARRGGGDDLLHHDHHGGRRALEHRPRL
jgi:hypothetical protein